MRKTSLQMQSDREDVRRSIDVTSTTSPYNTVGQIVGDIPHNAALVETVVTLQLPLILLLFLWLDVHLMQKKWVSSLAISISG